MMKSGSNILCRGRAWAVAGMALLTGILHASTDCPPDCLSEGRMTGGGVIRALNEANGEHVQVTHAFVLHCDPHKARNDIQVSWDNQLQFYLESLAFAGCEDLANVDPRTPDASFDRIAASGYGRLNDASGAFVFVLFTDAGEPERDDVATIVIYDSNGTLVLSVTGHLDDGKHQAHNEPRPPTVLRRVGLPAAAEEDPR